MPSPRKTTTPSEDARPLGSDVTSACTCTLRERPGASANRSGRTENEIAAAPLVKLWTSAAIASRRVETLRTTIRVTDCQPTSSARPSASEPGLVVNSDAAAAPRSRRPEPCAASELPGSGRAVFASKLRRARASNDGRACASSAAAPPTTAAAALDPLTVPKRDVPSEFAPGSEVAIPTPCATTSGFTRPSNARPPEENVETRRRLAFVRTRIEPIDSTGFAPDRIEAIARSAAVREIPTTGTGTSSSRPSEPLGVGPSP